MFILAYFIIGACFGSFGLWLSQQLVSEQSIQWTRRSHCKVCYHTLAVKDLIPIISFITYGRKCPYCSSKIPFYYLWGELSAGCLAVLWFFISSDLKIGYLLLFFILFVMSWCDLLAGWVPDTLQWGLFITCLWCFKATLFTHWLSWLTAFLLFTCLCLILLIRPHWIGGADIKLLTILALTLPIEFIPWLLFLASLSALFYITILYIWKKRFILSVRFIPFITFNYLILLYFSH